MSHNVIQTGAIRKFGCGFLFAFPSIVTVAVSVAVWEIFSVKEWRDLKNQVRGSFKVIENGAVQ